MGFKDYVAKKKEQTEAFIEKQRYAAEQRKTKQEFKAKLDRHALAEDATQARKKMAVLKQAERDKATIRQLKDYKQSQRKPIFSGMGSGMGSGFGSDNLGIDFGSSKSGGMMGTGSDKDMFGDMFGPTPRKKSKKRTKSTRRKSYDVYSKGGTYLNTIPMNVSEVGEARKRFGLKVKKKRKRR